MHLLKKEQTKKFDSPTNIFIDNLMFSLDKCQRVNLYTNKLGVVVYLGDVIKCHAAQFMYLFSTIGFFMIGGWRLICAKLRGAQFHLELFQ
jgi:hypothetical protein